MKPKHERMLYIFAALCLMATAVTLVAVRFRDNLIYFYTPTDLQSKRRAGEVRPGETFRLGGLVETGSLIHPDAGRIRFTVTDGKDSFTVHYKGLLPTLFREGQGVVLLGTLDTAGEITASSILAKHDETYMPPEVARALKKSGHWEGQKTP